MKRTLKAAVRSLKRVVEISNGIMMAMPAPSAPTARQKLVELSHHKRRYSVTQINEERVSKGHRLFGLLLGESLRAYGWGSGQGCKVFLLYDIDFLIPEKSVYIWDCFTEPSQRNKGYFKLLLQHIPQYFSDIDIVYVAVDVDNKASRAAIQGAGYRTLFSYLAVRLLGRVRFALAFKAGRPVGLRSTLEALQVARSSE